MGERLSHLIVDEPDDHQYDHQEHDGQCRLQIDIERHLCGRGLQLQTRGTDQLLGAEVDIFPDAVLVMHVGVVEHQLLGLCLLLFRRQGQVLGAQLDIRDFRRDLRLRIVPRFKHQPHGLIFTPDQLIGELQSCCEAYVGGPRIAL